MQYSSSATMKSLEACNPTGNSKDILMVGITGSQVNFTSMVLSPRSSAQYISNAWHTRRGKVYWSTWVLWSHFQSSEGSMVAQGWCSMVPGLWSSMEAQSLMANSCWSEGPADVEDCASGIIGQNEVFTFLRVAGMEVRVLAWDAGYVERGKSCWPQKRQRRPQALWRKSPVSPSS